MMVVSEMLLPELEAGYEDELDALLRNKTLTVAEKMQTILKMGLQAFHLDVGIISRLNEDAYLVEHFYPDLPGVAKGYGFKFSQAYNETTRCLRMTVAIINLERHSQQPYASNEAFHLEDYIDTPIFLNKRLYGTLNFSSVQPRKDRFSPADRHLMGLFGKAVTQLLEKQAYV